MKLIRNFLLLLGLLVVAQHVQAGPLEGKAFFVDSTGAELIPGGQGITGDIDVNSGVMNVDPWGPFFGFMVSTQNIEVLTPGTYTRDAGTVTVLDGQVGAHMELEWAANIIPVFMVWNVSTGGSIFTIADDDSDGVPGHTMTVGPFTGVTVYYEFTVNGISEPYVKLTIDTNGQYHECVDGVAEVTMTAVTQLFGGAVLDSVTWDLDNVSLGTGLVKIEELQLGNYVVNATAITTTGQSDDASASFSVRDTTRPVVNVSFLDRNGTEVTSSEHGKVTVSIAVTDSCDSDPVITSSTATPTTTVSDGDVMFVNEKGGINLPVTAVRVTVTAKDASGNFSFTTSESSKTITLE